MIADKLTSEQYESTCVDADEQNKTGWYNMKLIQYENGVSELRTYSEVVGRKPCNMPDELLVVKQLVAREYAKLKKHTFYNPFEDIEMGLYDLDEIEISDRRKKHSARNSRSRTVQQIYKYARQCKWEYFLTLTYAEQSHDFSECMKQACKWFNNQRSRYAPDLQYLIVPEQHKSGAWHIHGLIANCGNIKFVDSGHDYKGRKRYNCENWAFGFTVADPVTDTEKISGYITKYITKELCESTEGRRRYFRSRNILEPQETEFLVEGSEKVAFAEMLADSVGMEHTYRKEISGYIGVKYDYYERMR